jgi:hypothetical protein
MAGEKKIHEIFKPLGTRSKTMKESFKIPAAKRKF